MVLCASSCDSPPMVLFEKPANFVWSEHPAEPMDRHVTSFYWKEGAQVWVFLENKPITVPVPSGWTQYLILCLEEEEKEVEGDCGCECTVIKLKAGLMVIGGSGFPIRDQEIEELGTLMPGAFLGYRTSKNAIRISYNGRIDILVNRPPISYSRWLRFEVKAKKNEAKVHSTVNQFYPLLRKERKAEELVRCLTPLISMPAQ